jgi:hypothetical protein
MAAHIAPAARRKRFPTPAVLSIIERLLDADELTRGLGGRSELGLVVPDAFRAATSDDAVHDFREISITFAADNRPIKAWIQHVSPAGEAD